MLRVSERSPDAASPRVALPRDSETPVGVPRATRTAASQGAGASGRLEVVAAEDLEDAVERELEALGRLAAQELEDLAADGGAARVGGGVAFAEERIEQRLGQPARSGPVGVAPVDLCVAQRHLGAAWRVSGTGSTDPPAGSVGQRSSRSPGEESDGHLVRISDDVVVAAGRGAGRGARVLAGVAVRHT